MRKNSSFTLVEVLIVIIVLAILAAIAIPIYQNRIEQTRIDICTANQEALLEAVKIYDMKYDAMPNSLAKAWRKNGEEAMAIVWERKKKGGDYTYLAYISFQKFKYFLANIFSINTLYAQSFSSTLADISILKCPSDPTPYNGIGNYSYGINIDAVQNPDGSSNRWSNVTAEGPIIGDSDTAQITGVGALAGNRHKMGGYGVALYIDRNGHVEEVRGTSG